MRYPIYPSLLRIAAALLLAGALIDASAQSADAMLPVADYLKQPRLAGLTLAPSGKFLAGTMPSKGRMNLVVIDLDSLKGALLTSFEDFDVIGIRWVGDARLVFSLGQANSPTGPGQFDGGGLFWVSRDGGESKRLSPTLREVKAKGGAVYRQMSFFRAIPGNVDEIVVEGNLTSADATDLYRLNLLSGKAALLTRGRPDGRTSDWIMDGKLVPRVVATTQKDSTESVVHYRADADSPWHEIARFDATKGPAFVPLAFDTNDKTLQVATNAGRNTMAIFRYAPETRTQGELLAEHPLYDMGADGRGSATSGVLVDPESDRVLGYEVNAARPLVTWADDKYNKTQQMIDSALPGTLNRFKRLPGGNRMLVVSESDVKTTRWYLLDESKRTLEEIGASRPWLDGHLVEQHPFTFRARDGMEIPGYYFLPRSYRRGQRLPTVVHVHGGPTVRADSWGRGFGVMEAQLLASRGYAVVVPNFRITPGLGSKIYYGGFGTIGREMSDDHEDALKWAVEEGFADGARACISGASYGGYAALQAMIRTPKAFRCAVAGLAVTDLPYQLTTTETDFSRSDSALNFWRRIIGNNDLSGSLAREMSPINHVDKIKAPVFLYAGRDDVRVPIDQITRMARALERAGNPPKAFVVKDKEGHGFGRIENNVDLYNQIIAFLNEQIGTVK